MLQVITGLLLSATPQPCEGSTRGVEACLERELARADADLNRYYVAAVRRLEKEGQHNALIRLRRAEKAWITYRDAECDAVWEYWKEGTIRGTFAAECRIRITRARTRVIWRDWLTFADSTPALLPEPS